MKWSNVWKLKKDWVVERYDDDYVYCYHVKSGLSTKIKLPELIKQLMDWQYKRGQRAKLNEIQRALNITSKNNY